jgi:hypothetical protein
MFNRRGLRRIVGGMLVLGTGMVFGGSGCRSGLANVNPCGTVLSTQFCDPDQYQLIFGDIFDPSFSDPTCTVPFECGTFTDPDTGA